jgi:hypothetical protein
LVRRFPPIHLSDDLGLAQFRGWFYRFICGKFASSVARHVPQWCFVFVNGH